MKEFVFNVCKEVGAGEANPSGAYVEFWNDWRAIVGLALFVSAFMLALLLIAARFFRNQQIEVWVRAEIGQLFVTGAIAALAIFSVHTLCSLQPSSFNSILGAGGQRYEAGLNFYDAASDYMVYLRNLNLETYGALTLLFYVVNGNLGVTYHANPVGVGFSTQVLAGFAPLTQIIIMVTQALTVSFLLVLIQIKVIEYLSIATLTYLFPIGVLLRAFEPLRMFGGALIALSLGMFIMYPALLVLNDYVIRGDVNENWVVKSTDESLQKSSQGIGALTNLQNKRGTENGELNEGVVTGILWQMCPLMSGAMIVFIASVFLPAMNFSVIIGFIKELSHLLGEEMDIASITRMI